MWRNFLTHFHGFIECLREGFVFEQEKVERMTGFVMKYYRWKKDAAAG